MWPEIWKVIRRAAGGHRSRALFTFGSGLCSDGERGEGVPSSATGMYGRLNSLCVDVYSMIGAVDRHQISLERSVDGRLELAIGYRVSMAVVFLGGEVESWMGSRREGSTYVRPSHIFAGRRVGGLGRDDHQIRSEERPMEGRPFELGGLFFFLLRPRKYVRPIEYFMRGDRHRHLIGVWLMRRDWSWSWSCGEVFVGTWKRKEYLGELGEESKVRARATSEKSAVAPPS